jgi:hypothetical protein
MVFFVKSISLRFETCLIGASENNLKKNGPSQLLQHDLTKIELYFMILDYQVIKRSVDNVAMGLEATKIFLANMSFISCQSRHWQKN